ncbi:hypothetical protein CE91St28_15250 [Pyramidobacter piscolens]|nr:hypothetical protein CE91St28_15250 [Pyramidobacter piscolens]
MTISFRAGALPCAGADNMRELARRRELPFVRFYSVDNFMGLCIMNR